MAIIPNDEKFIGLSASVNTTERRSALINSESQAYTMQDITDTVSAGLPPATNPTNQYVPYNLGTQFADSPFLITAPPVPYYGVPSFQTKVGTLVIVPPGVTNYNISQFLPNYGIKVENFDVTGVRTKLGSYDGGGMNFSINGTGNGSLSNSLYVTPYVVGQNSPFLVKGDGSLVQIGQQPNFNNTNIINGIIFNRTGSFFKLNCGIASPNDGIISANGSTGLVMMGTNGAGYSLGVNFYNNTIHAGSGLTSPNPPVDPYTPISWLKVSDEYGNNYNIPLYQ